MPRNVVLLPGLALMLALSVWLTLRSFQPQELAEPEATVQRPRYHLEGADWMRYDDTGAALFEVTANSVDYFDDASMLLQAVSVRHLGGTQGAWLLTSDRGSVPAGQKRLLLEPQVIVDGQAPQQDDVTLHTPQLWVNFDARTISSPAAVRAEAPGRSLDAIGMQADWTGERVEFLDQVEVHHAPLQ
ncbi:LPS export ABC transporter periplasmic protein LptC [Sinimarinibacterium sp. CAU 1509]|uniref:LPS export ABC transporter periplasmic protein LptC n=1 Tax=Sinimarinibacterium sp. CAU 1509 TaxID=2562283 RepID=UPI0010AC5D29|nr:LPS export ABC transporter periplasmic protein LptC [Sinimarinibacterium sp. CAU 1509]TJY65139.1 LPS export ABC transporter periplasmic protein LptC [Sinimarinibacterium sp. CAU 1509]